jgi:hypothetical protein
MPLYEHETHPRLQELKAHPPTTIAEQRVKKDNVLGRINARVGLFITVVVGTMWCAYLFTLLALVSFPAAIKTHDKLIIVAWIAQTFLQLVLLPIIIVGQNEQAAASDRRSESTYKDAEAVLHESIEIQKHLAAQDTAIEHIMDQVAALTRGSV